MVLQFMNFLIATLFHWLSCCEHRLCCVTRRLVFLKIFELIPLLFFFFITVSTIDATFRNKLSSCKWSCGKNILLFHDHQQIRILIKVFTTWKNLKNLEFFEDFFPWKLEFHGILLIRKISEILLILFFF